jgi:hypothetical protein
MVSFYVGEGQSAAQPSDQRPMRSTANRAIDHDDRQRVGLMADARVTSFMSGTHRKYTREIKLPRDTTN